VPPDYHVPHTETPSTADLAQTAVAQIKTLMRDELALAKTEMRDKGKQVGFAGGLLGGAAVLALYGFALLLALTVSLLALMWPLWVALLVVTAVVFAAAALTALFGKQKIRDPAPPLPPDPAASVREDVEALADAFERGRHS